MIILYRKKPTHLPHPHTKPTYGAKVQFALTPDDSAPLTAEAKQQLQAITRALLYYGRAADNKLLDALSTIVTQTYTRTQQTATHINHLLNYVATYPNDRVIYRESAI